METTDERQPDGATTQRLWTPWRMQYVGGGAKEPGCIFCNRLRADDDVASLILYRGDHCFVIMNLFPYNTGHVMIVPNRHVDSPEALDGAELAEMASLLPVVLRASRRALACHGFNIGINVGSIAGAGVADHLHEHVVPRWNGDANFMPIIGSAMVLPELIPVTYAKLRAELTRETTHAAAAAALLVSDDHTWLARRGGAFGVEVPLSDERPVWRASLAALEINAVLAGWAGNSRTDADGRIALTFTASSGDGNDIDWVSVDQAMRDWTEIDRTLAARALAQIAPTVAPAPH